MIYNQGEFDFVCKAMIGSDYIRLILESTKYRGYVDPKIAEYKRSKKESFEAVNNILTDLLLDEQEMERSLHEKEK